MIARMYLAACIMACVLAMMSWTALWGQASSNFKSEPKPVMDASSEASPESFPESYRFFLKLKPSTKAVRGLQMLLRTHDATALFPQMRFSAALQQEIMSQALGSTPVLATLASKQMTVRAIKVAARSIAGASAGASAGSNAQEKVQEEVQEECAGGINRLFIVESQIVSDVQACMEELRGMDEVEYVEQERFLKHSDLRSPADIDVPDVSAAPKASIRAGSLAQTANDTYFGVQWSLQNTGQLSRNYYPAGKAGADINANRAWDISTGSSRVIVAIIDTGVPLPNGQTPVDFTGRLVTGYNFAQPTATVADDDGHGSNVASILAATGNNGRFVAGVDWKCMIMPLKVSSRSGRIANSSVIAALRYAADNGARVANLSLGSASASAAERDALVYAASKGLISVVAMGNDNTSVPEYPAGYSTDPATQVIAVGATDNLDNRANPFTIATQSSGGSNYGAHISFVAPGNALLGVDNNGSSLSYFSGTSQATPVVAGLVSLLLSVKPTMSFQEVMTALKAGARDMVGPASEDTKGWDPYFGWGRVDAYRSLLAVINPTTSPTTSVQETSLSQTFPASTASSQSSSEAAQAITGVFPNPARDILTVECSTPPSVPLNAPSLLVVTNALGERVYETSLTAMSSTIQIDVRSWPSGMYGVRLTSARGVAVRPVCIVR
jgi:hypothetical protein